MGSITPIPPRWVVVSTYNATGQLALFNAGVVTVHVPSAPAAAQCFFNCTWTSPSSRAFYRRRRLASGQVDRTIQMQRVLTTGLNLAQAIEIIGESDGCLGDYFILPTAYAGTLPSGTSWGDLLRASCFRSLHDALSSFPDASQNCVPPLPE